MVEESVKKKRIKGILFLYYSKPEVQEAIFEFCKNREISPRYFEGFGKRPDAFQYKGDIFELAKRGATSFHCSEEIWEDPLSISTDQNEEELNNIRTGWDFLLDIDCKYFDYTKIVAQAIIETLERFGVKNIGIKFSGSKGFHILIPWKAFPKEINGIKTSDLFPELPRKLIAFIRDYSQKIFKDIFTDEENLFRNAKIKRGIKCRKCDELADVFEKIELYCPFCRVGEIRKIRKESLKENYFCPECKRELINKSIKEFSECKKCKINSEEEPNNFSEDIDQFELMGLDLIMVSPRHLFRAPYSLHEKTSLASVVLTKDELKDFELKDADPMKVRIRNFMPNAKEGEANELVTQALDWAKNREIMSGKSEEKATGKFANFKPIELKNIEENEFPPCVKNILKGIEDGKKRALFILINVFRSAGMEKEELEKKIFEWNKKNKPPLKQGYILGQLKWSYRKKPILPPNCKEFYSGIGVCTPDNFCSKIKNPVNYLVKKNMGKNSRRKKS